MASRFVLPFADVGSGIKPSSGAKLFFFETGTSTPKDTFSDSAGTVPNSNPVISDSTGVFSDIFIDGEYKVVLKNKNDVQIWEADPVSAFLTDVDYTRLFKNVSDLKNGVDSSGNNVDMASIVGSRVQWMGYYIESDGGGNWGIVKSGSHTEDGGSIFSIDVDTYVEANLKWEIVDVRKFGAKGDFDATLQTGSDDSTAFQAMFDYLGTIPNQRNTGSRSCRFPRGQYRIGSLITIPSSLGFGLDIYGDGWKDGTGVWFDQSIPGGIGMLLEIEFTKFNDIRLNGGLTISGNFADRIQTIIKARLPDARADIDIEFNDCMLFGGHELVRCVGRGCKITGGSIAAFNSAMVIESDPVNAAANPRIIMRNYVVSNTRVDGGDILVEAVGDGIQKEHILGIQLVGLDVFKLKKLISAPDATLRKLSISALGGHDNYTDGVISCKNLIGFNIGSSSFTRKADDNISPTTADEMIYRFIDATDTISQGVISGCNVSQLQDALLAATAVDGVNVTGNAFPDLWVYDGGVSSSVLIRSPGKLDPTITFTGNSSSSVGGKVGSRIFDTNLLPKNIEMHSNSFNVNVRDYWTFVPTITFNGVPSAKTPTSTTGRYKKRGEFVEVDFSLLVSSFTETGALGITIPPGLTPLPVNASITNTYAGGGLVDKGSGLGGGINSQPSLLVNPITGVASVVVWTSGTESQINIGSPGTISLYGNYKFKVR